MSFPTYPAYKDSGVEWLGDVPEHWYSARFSRVVMAIKDGTHGTFERVDEGVPLLSAKNVQNGFLDINEGESLISEDDSRSIVSNGFPSAGDLLLTIVGTIGRSCVYTADKPYAFQRSVCFLRFYKRYSSYFFYYFSQSKFFQEQLAGRSKSSAQAGVYMGDVVATSVVFPPDFSEQTQIARFLDHETARIDALIKEQQRLIELLKEKRQAVISHAVTKGLDPTVPMKDSGVEWLGEVPAHWDVVRVKHIKSWRPNAFVDGPFGSNLKSEHFVDDGGVYVIESGFATTGALSFSDLKQITPKHFETIQRSEVCAGDIVIAKIGARYGMCSILPWLDKPAVVSGNSLKLTVNDEICDSRFAVFVLQHLKERGAIEDIVNMTAQPALSLGEMNNLPFPLPSLSEQLSIVSELEIELGEFEALTSECQRVMSLAVERRSALISAAVTGKIDVRGWQPPVSTQAPKLAVAEAN